MIELWKLWPLLPIALALRQRWRRRSGREPSVDRSELLAVVVVSAIGMFALAERPERQHSQAPATSMPPLSSFPTDERPAVTRKATFDAVLATDDVLRLDLDGVSCRIEAGPSGRVLATLATIPEVEPEGLGLTLNRIEGGLAVRLRLAPESATPELVLSVPRTTLVTGTLAHSSVVVHNMGRVELNGSASNIALESVDREVTIIIENGALKARGIRGDLTVSAVAGSIDAHAVQGDVTIRSTYSRIRLNRVSGTADIEAQGASVGLSAINGAVRVAAPQALITLSGLDGGVDVETTDSHVKGGQIRNGFRIRAANTTIGLTEVDGGVQLLTSLRQTQLKRIQGSLQLEADGGDVHVEQSSGDLDLKLVDAVARIRRHHGSVVAAVARGSLFIDGGQIPRIVAHGVESQLEVRNLGFDGINLDLRAEPGWIEVPSSDRPTRRGATATLQQVVRNGSSRVELSVEHGIIRVER